MTGAEIVQILVVIFGSGGVLAGLWSVWSTRSKPKLDKQQVDNATRKNNADIFSIHLAGLEKIIDEYREAREDDREQNRRRLEEAEHERDSLEKHIEALEERISKTENRVLKYEDVISTAIIHIATLERHIQQQFPPPPPELPPLLKL